MSDSPNGSHYLSVIQKLRAGNYTVFPELLTMDEADMAVTLRLLGNPLSEKEFWAWSDGYHKLS
ncbi:MAG: hypothetical protein ABI747_04635 [Candidatus Moraniibacteriota bacterium]